MAVTLREQPLGRTVRIRGFRALPRAQERRLLAMGLGPQSPVTKLLRTPLKDPVECLAGSRLVAVEAWLLDHILVTP